MMMRSLLAVCGMALAAHATECIPGIMSKTSCQVMLTNKQDTQATGARKPQTQVPDQSLGTNQLYPGNRVWQDLAESAWKYVPEWLMGTQMVVPSSIITGRKQMYWQCAAQQWTNEPHCEIYAFAYGCQACDYEKGDFQQLMADSGFVAFRCSPVCKSRTGGSDHHLIGYVKVISAGTDFTLPITAAKTEFITFGMSPSPSMCDAHTAAGEQVCEQADHGKCEWNTQQGQCVFKTCNRVPIGPGPSTPCTKVCINDDL